MPHSDEQDGDTLSPTEKPQPPCKTDPRAPHGFLRNESHTQNRYVCECEFWEPEDKPTSQDYFFRKSAIDWEAEAGKQAMRCEEYKALLRQALEALELSQPAWCGQDEELHDQECIDHRAAIEALRERLK